MNTTYMNVNNMLYANGPPRPKRVIAKQINNGDHFGHSEILKPGPRLHT